MFVKPKDKDLSAFKFYFTTSHLLKSNQATLRMHFSKALTRNNPLNAAVTCSKLQGMRFSDSRQQIPSDFKHKLTRILYVMMFVVLDYFYCKGPSCSFSRFIKKDVRRARKREDVQGNGKSLIVKEGSFENNDVMHE